MKFLVITLLCVFVLGCNAGPIARQDRPYTRGRQGCRRIYDPVCGSDGVTYSNLCVFQNAQRRSDNEDLTLASEGRCPDLSDCPDSCMMSFDPICGSDGRTYSNLCLLRIARCKNPDLTQVIKGACPDTREKRASTRARGCPDICMSMFEPVCGSDGTTYSNRCELEKASCLQNTRINLVRGGRCEDCNTPCPLYYLPVCGSDGILYGNDCLFKAQQCRDATLAKGTNCFN